MVVEPLDVIEYVRPCVVPGAIHLAGCPLGFQRGEEALHRCVVPDVARPADAAADVMIGQQLLKLLTAILAALIRMMQQCVRFTAAPDRYHQRVRNQLGRHRGAHRPTDDTAREQVDDGGRVEPALCRPDVGEVGDPFLVRRRGLELPIQHVVRCLVPGAFVRGQPSAAWPGPQSLLAHQTLDTVQPACGTLGEHVVPDPPGTIRPIAANEACLDLCPEHFIAACPSTGRTGKPGVKPTARDTERLAKPPHRPDPSMFRDEAELHIESLAK